MLLTACLLLLFSLTGCGGGGGGGGGGDADPLYSEISAQTDGFIAAVNAGNLDEAMGFVDSNLFYYPMNGESVRISAFRDRLAAFLQGSSERQVVIEDREVLSNGETSALFAGRLACTWKDLAGVSHTAAPETVEMFWEWNAKWGITKISGHADQGLAFPPAP